MLLNIALPFCLLLQVKCPCRKGEVAPTCLGKPSCNGGNLHFGWFWLLKELAGGQQVKTLHSQRPCPAPTSWAATTLPCCCRKPQGPPGLRSPRRGTGTSHLH